MIDKFNNEKQTVHNCVSVSPQNKTISKEQGLEKELIQYVCDRMNEVVEIAKKAMRIESVVEDDTRFVKDSGKKFFMCGFGCAIVYLKYDNRSKLAKRIEELCQKNYSYFQKQYEKYFDKETLKRYEKLGFPLGGLFNQDEQVQLKYNHILQDFMLMKGVKNVRVISYLD